METWCKSIAEQYETAELWLSDFLKMNIFHLGLLRDNVFW